VSAFSGYRVKDRSAKVAKRRNAMPVTGKGVFVLQSVIQAKAEEARRNLEARAPKQTGKLR
jgi:hypothetical protein